MGEGLCLPSPPDIVPQHPVKQCLMPPLQVSQEKWTKGCTHSSGTSRVLRCLFHPLPCAPQAFLQSDLKSLLLQLKAFSC